MSSRWLKGQIKKAVGKYLDLKKHKIFLFGSRVAGNSFEHSDIDIGIEGVRRIHPSTILKVKDELETIPILYTIDFVDFRSVNSKFRAIAKRYIEKIN